MPRSITINAITVDAFEPAYDVSVARYRVGTAVTVTHQDGTTGTYCQPLAGAEHLGVASVTMTDSMTRNDVKLALINQIFSHEGLDPTQGDQVLDPFPTAI